MPSAENVVIILRQVRSRVANFQEAKGIAKTEQYAFVDLIKALCTHTFEACRSIVVMLYNFLPLLEILAYLLRFVLDNTIDILETTETSEKVFKSIVFVGQVIVLTLVVYIILSFLLVPIIGFILSFVLKLFRISWK